MSGDDPCRLETVLVHERNPGFGHRSFEEHVVQLDLFELLVAELFGSIFVAGQHPVVLHESAESTLRLCGSGTCCRCTGNRALVNDCLVVAVVRISHPVATVSVEVLAVWFFHFLFFLGDVVSGQILDGLVDEDLVVIRHRVVHLVLSVM